MRVHVAGSMAERTKFTTRWRDGASSDRHMFHKDAKFLFGWRMLAPDGSIRPGQEGLLAGSEILEMRRRYEDDCRRIFMEPGVEAVAQAALDCTTLSGGFITALRPEQVDLGAYPTRASTV